jgi:predicted helicase
MPVKTFLAAVAHKLNTGNATEHTYRSALEHLFTSVILMATVINEPKQAEYGAPDLLILQGNIPIGHVEAKDIGVDLSRHIADSERETPKTASGKQLQRYRAALPNLLYTDGLEWHWFVEGKPRLAQPLRIANWDANARNLHVSSTAEADLTSLLEQFAAHKASLVGTPTDLAQRLAQIARWLNELIHTVLTTEDSQGSLQQQLAAFRQTLLPTLTPVEFADMYAQTLVYGLFAARIAQATRSSFTRYDAAQTIPKTNPFLQEMFYQIAGPRLDTRIAWLVDDCARLLERTDMSEVLKDFGKATRQEDPVVHFYETFLAAYDPITRERRGVYYTPEPVVSYIVRSIDHLLQTRFGKPMGLADGETMILDPATGTATFLHAVVQHIHATLQGMGMADAWNQYVPDKLLARLFGFELLMAPYTIAHLKLSMLLQQLGYTFDNDDRLGIYMTNALSDAPTGQQTLPFARFIAEEGQAADAIKHDKPVMVVLGNPPYSYESANTGEWIGNLVHDYYQVDGKPLGERNPKGLQDDYVKFIRFGQWRINHTGEGVLAFISNNGYLDNPTFRGMRESLLHDFDTIYLLNLHGDSRKKERAPDRSPDENVFDIQQGVAIGIFLKQDGGQQPATVYYADLWGKATEKYTFLAAQDVHTINWQTLAPVEPWYYFVPYDTHILPEYATYWNIAEVAVVHSLGIATARDQFTVRWTAQDVVQTMQHFAALSSEEARIRYKLGADTQDWKVSLAQDDIRSHQHTLASHGVPLAYRPFDTRYTFYTGQSRGVLCRPRAEVMQHLVQQENIALCCMRRSRDNTTANFYVSTTLTDKSILSVLDNAIIAPLYLYPNGNNHPTLFDYENGRRPNLSAAFIQDVEQRLQRSFIPDGCGDLETTIGPEDIFHYIYAGFHSPTYRERYAEFLKRDFPHIPLTSDIEQFKTLRAYGAMLVDLHLLRLPGSGGVGGAGGAAILTRPGDQGITQHAATTKPIAQISYQPQEQRVMIASESFFAGIDPSTWNMQIGGYQPLHKWLKDRKGRTLSFDDALHYMRMVIALRETQRLMAEIENVIPSWPPGSQPG